MIEMTRLAFEALPEWKTHSGKNEYRRFRYVDGLDRPYVLVRHETTREAEEHEEVEIQILKVALIDG